MSARGAAGAGLPSSPWSGGTWAWLRTPDRRFLVLAILLQLALAAIPLHRSYDRTVFEAAGYLVATGGSPYVPQDLSAVFHAAFFRDFATIGYPPPWPLLLGGIYRATYAIVPNLQLYAVAIKLPTIAAGIALAYLSGATLHNLGAAPVLVRRAWLAILFNPFLIYVAAIRGQIDPIVAVLALAAVLLVASGRLDLSAVTLALAVCVKPIAAPLLLAVLLAIAAVSLLRALRYAAVVAAGVFAFYVVPFLILGWDRSPLHQANAQFALAGAMSPATIARIWTDPVVLGDHWWLLGLLWIPALAVVAVLARRGAHDFGSLLMLSVAFALVFFLVRTWLAETNVILLLAPALVLVVLGHLDRRLYTALWVLPLASTVLYLWPLKLLWAVAPGVVARGAVWAEQSGGLVLAAQIVLIVTWQVAGWWIVVVCLRRLRPAAGGQPGAASPAREALP